MLSFLYIKKKLMGALLDSRKMNFNEIEGLYVDEGDFIRSNLLQLSQAATLLDVSLGYIIKQIGDYPSDIKDRVKICRAGTQFERLKVVNSEPTYLYRHVMKTSADKNLMVLRTSPMFTSSEQATLNEGHLVKEIVYILSGVVGVLWRNGTGERRNEILSAGDSIYIDSWVSHSFYSLEADSQILAVDYL